MVKEGYKQTDIGVLPEDWEVKEIGELGEVVRGGSPRPAGDSRFFNGNFIPWLTVASLTNLPKSEIYVKSTSNMLTEEGSKRSRTLELDTVIISNSGATLGVAKILNIQCCANDGIAAIINQKLADKPFLVQYFNTLTKYLHDIIATGNGQPNLNTTLIKNIKIPFPPEKEQKAISKALLDTDELINSIEKLIAKKEAIKQGTMQQLLTGKKRLAGFSGEWEVKKLGDFLDYEQPTNYLVTSSKYTENGEVPVLTAGKTFILGYTSEDYGIFTNLPTIIFDDFTIAIKFVDFPFKAKSSAMKMLIPQNDKVNLRFVYAIMSQIKYQVGDHKRHWIGEFRNLEILFPPTSEEQQAITKILSDMDNEIKILKAKLSKTKAIKEAMMSELLTGKTRLKVSDS